MVTTGTHLGHPLDEAVALEVLEIAGAAELRPALNIDYRPNLWGVAGLGEGESRLVAGQDWFYKAIFPWRAERVPPFWAKTHAWLCRGCNAALGPFDNHLHGFGR